MKFEIFLLCTFCFVHKATSTGSKVFLLVLDGFIHDYDKHTSNMPNFAQLAAEGVKTEKLIPAFPSSTWPCMTTLNTGLYTESHGIINNVFTELETGKIFDYNGDPSDYENNGRFFTQEPIWLTNQKQNGVSSVFYWPGYYAFPEKPKYHNKRIVPEGANITTGREAIDETFEYLASDNDLNFMVVYVDAPDETGHKYGPGSVQYKNRLEQIDRDILGYLLKKLENHEDINLVVVADHGQVDLVSPDKRLILYDNYLKDNTTYISEPTCGPNCNLGPTSSHTTEELFDKLKPLAKTGHYNVYMRNDLMNDFPRRIHYKKNKNIQSILILPDPGFLVASRKDNIDGLLSKKGAHGFDPIHETMGTIFFAKGPAFKKGVVMKPFESVNIVPLLAHLLGVTPKPNNGSVYIFGDVLVNRPGSTFPVNYSFTTYILIFVGLFFTLLIIFAGFYFSFMYFYAYFCRPKVKYVLVEQ